MMALAAPGIVHASVIGKNQPAQSLTVERLTELPAAPRAAWAAYIKRSQAQMQRDRAALAPARAPGQTPTPPPEAGSGHMPLDKDATWYATPEARAIADT